MITALYVPGDRPDRFDKAVATGADLVILDLEDAVTPANKAAAREAVTQWLTAHPSGSRPAVEVRVNAGDDDDLAALAGATDVGIRLPKVESGADVDRVVDVLGAVAIAAVVETAVGVEALGEITRHRAVRAVSLGEADLASDLGTRHPRVLDAVRARLLVAARAAGLPPPMASVFTDIADLDGLRADTEVAREMGFVGRAAIHPVQVPVIAAAFAPSFARVGLGRRGARRHRRRWRRSSGVGRDGRPGDARPGGSDPPPRREDAVTTSDKRGHRVTTFPRDT